jgi:hypothetical protein
MFWQLNGLRSVGGYSGNKAVATYALVKGGSVLILKLK